MRLKRNLSLSYAMRSLLLIITFCQFILPINGQVLEDIDEVNLYDLYRAHEKVKIPVERILGNWIAEDEEDFEIQFIDEAFRVQLMPQVYINPFGFLIENDSIVSVGVAMNWPPYYCFLTLDDEDVLEVKYYIYGVDEFLIYYFKREVTN